MRYINMLCRAERRVKSAITCGCRFLVPSISAMGSLIAENRDEKSEFLTRDLRCVYVRNTVNQMPRIENQAIVDRCAQYI